MVRKAVMISLAKISYFVSIRVDIAVIFNLTLAFHWIGSVPFVEYFYLPEKGPNYESAQAFSQVGAPKPHVKFTVSPALVGARQH
jgi:hypothetical protein